MFRMAQKTSESWKLDWSRVDQEMVAGDGVCRESKPRVKVGDSHARISLGGILQELEKPGLGGSLAHSGLKGVSRVGAGQWSGSRSKRAKGSRRKTGKLTLAKGGPNDILLAQLVHDIQNGPGVSILSITARRGEGRDISYKVNAIDQN